MPLEKLHIARPHLTMPDFIYDELVRHNLLDQFLSRDADRQDSDIAWIDIARKASIRDKRLDDLIAELSLEEPVSPPIQKKWFRNPR